MRPIGILLTDAVERFADAFCALEFMSIRCESEENFVDWNTGVHIISDDLLGRAVSTGGVLSACVEIRRVTGAVTPRSGIIICHDIPSVKILVHLGGIHGVVLLWCDWAYNRDLKAVSASTFGRVSSSALRTSARRA